MKELLTKVSGKVSESREALMENLSFDKLSERISGMNDAAKEKSIGIMNDLISLSPIIDEVGFKTTGISVSVGLPPDVTFHFVKEKDVSPEERDAILEQHKDKPMLNTIVKTLFIADSYQQKLKLGAFRFTEIDVCIGITGGVSFKLVRG